MISVEQALKKIENTVKVSTPIQKALAESFGLVLAEDVLLICQKDEEQKIKQFVNDLKQDKHNKFL